MTDRLGEALANKPWQRTGRQTAVVDAAARSWHTLTNGAEVWYWVTPVDDVDALGEYGGFTFQTYDEAVAFIQSEYAEHAKGKATGYYEPDSSPSLLQVETVRTIGIEVVDALTVTGEPTCDGSQQCQATTHTLSCYQSNRTTLNVKAALTVIAEEEK